MAPSRRAWKSVTARQFYVPKFPTPPRHAMNRGLITANFLNSPDRGRTPYGTHPFPEASLLEQLQR
jgi:hypothetical protein